MENQRRRSLSRSIKVILKPVVKLCLRYSLTLQELIEIQKQIFVELAGEHLESEGQRVTVSRISAITGVHRKDATRLYRDKKPKKETGNVTIRVIGLWRENPKFTDDRNRPRVLEARGNDSEFANLVKMVSTDIPASSVLIALEKVDAIERVSKGEGVRLKATSYVPRNDPNEGLRLLGNDVEDLVEAVLENIDTHEGALPNYHAKSMFDNIVVKQTPTIRTWLEKECDKFQTKVEKYLARHDLDMNPELEENGGGRVVLGVFSRFS